MRNVVNADPDPVVGAATTSPIDLGFLEAQTFGDASLEREVLGLFVEQARRVVPSLPGLPERQQREAAHLLKGSARGIGAWAAAAIAEAYETAEPAARGAMHGDVTAIFTEVEVAIEAHLAERG